jgi:hypothetical protein
LLTAERVRLPNAVFSDSIKHFATSCGRICELKISGGWPFLSQAILHAVWSNNSSVQFHAVILA